MTPQEAIAKAHDRVENLENRITNALHEQDAYNNFIRDVSTGMPITQALDENDLFMEDLEVLR